jgi:hypothetical protein
VSVTQFLRFLRAWLIVDFLGSVTYEVGHYEKHREDNKFPSDGDSKEELIKWKFQPPAQIGYQDYAVWWTDEVRESFCNVNETTLMAATEMGSLG